MMHRTRTPISERVSLRSSGPRARTGFTLFEILMSILVIGILLSILLLGVRVARSFTGSVVDDSAVQSVTRGVESFRTEHGFLPPLTREWLGDPGGAGAVTSNNRTLIDWNNAASITGRASLSVVRRNILVEETQLRTLTNPPSATVPLTFDNRFSEVSLATYLAGGLGVAYDSGNTGTLPIDGIDGPGMYKPTRGGLFEVPGTMRRANAAQRVRAGETFGPYVEVEGTALRLDVDRTADANGRAVRLLDRAGVPIRYYQWINGALVGGQLVVRDVNDLRVPPVVGRRRATFGAVTVVPPTDQDIEENPKLRSEAGVLNYAVVGAGPNKLFGDEDIAGIARELARPIPGNAQEEATLRNDAAKDNAVLLGRDS